MQVPEPQLFAAFQILTEDSRWRGLRWKDAIRDDVLDAEQLRLPAVDGFGVLFIRIHRSTIVNIGTIKEIQPWFAGEYVVLLRDGTKLQTSRRYRARLESLMQ